jgi:xylulokinase
MSFVIGCDIGTQSIKAVLLGEAGSVVARATSPHRTTYPSPGWAEQDPQAWIDGVGAVIRSLLAQSRVDPDAVVGIGVAGQVDGIVATDDRGRPLAPAPIWMDRRATAETARFAERAGAAAIRSTTGLNPDASHGVPKIAWLRARLPGAAAYLVPTAYVVAWLSGERAMDPANASCSMLWDLAAGTWSQRLLDAAEIDAATLGAVRPAAHVLGSLRPQAIALGLSERCQVVVGTGDEHAACLAAGILDPGVIGDVTGTAEPVAVAAHQPLVDPGGLVETHAHAVPDRFLVENPGFVSGGSVRWLAEDVLGCRQEDVGALAAEARPGSEGVLFLPALSGAVTPRWNESARGAFTGLRLGHARPHLARAVLEGCAYALRDIVDRLAALGLGGDVLRVLGGGARNELWLQIKADVTGLPAQTLLEPEATAMGAALLAGIGVGWYRDADAAVRATLRLGTTTVEPDRSVRDRYDEGYERYRALWDALEPTFVAPAVAP